MSQGHFQIAFLGDSIVWGQGLLDQHKFSTKLVAWVNQYHPAQNAYKTVTAHSGAVIGVGATQNIPPVDGEVPTAYPTILEQCDQVPGDPADVDLIVLNGGINDVSVEYILSPLTDQTELADTIQRACHDDLLTLLLKVAGRFIGPATQIVVMGYYPILSTKSDPLQIPTLLPLFDVSLSSFLAPVNPITKIVSNSLLFWQKPTVAMHQAVADANKQLATNRIVFVSPGFQEVNSAFASTPWIFAVSADLSPQDEVIAARHTSCQLDEPDLVQREICFRASAGHPNPTGAEAYFAALYPVLQQRYGF